MPGYTEFEKHQIARQFLIPKQLKSHGLKPKLVGLEEGAISDIINRYTKEAGVRNLEREISKCCRKIARQVAKNGNKNGDIQITSDNLNDFLGPPQYKQRQAEERDEIGVATGMVYTQVGGDIVAIEATTMQGEGELTLTGQLGDVMKESAQTALAYIRSQSDILELPNDLIRGSTAILPILCDRMRPDGLTVTTELGRGLFLGSNATDDKTVT